MNYKCFLRQTGRFKIPISHFYTNIFSSSKIDYFSFNILIKHVFKCVRLKQILISNILLFRILFSNILLFFYFFSYTLNKEIVTTFKRMKKCLLFIIKFENGSFLCCLYNLHDRNL